MCILITFVWGSLSASRYGADASVGPLDISARDLQWGIAPKNLSEYCGTLYGQSRFRFHQRLNLFYQETGGSSGTTVILNLNGDAVARVSDRSWLTLGVTPYAVFHGAVQSRSVDTGILPYALLVVNAYNPDFLVPSGESDCSGLGFVVDGLAKLSSQQPGDLNMRLRLRGPWTWRAQDWTLEAGPSCGLSRWAYSPRALVSTQELGFQVLGVLGTRTEETQLHPEEYLDRQYSGQLRFDVSWRDAVGSNSGGFWSRSNSLSSEAQAVAWLRAWRGLVLEPNLTVNHYVWLDEGMSSTMLVPNMALAYVARISSSGYLVPRIALEFGNVLNAHFWPGEGRLTASIAWHG